MAPGIPRGLFRIPFGRGVLTEGKKRKAKGGAGADEEAENESGAGRADRWSTADVRAGKLAHLLAPRDLARPDELVGLTIQCGGTGGTDSRAIDAVDAVMVIQHLRSGVLRGTRLRAEPLYIDIEIGPGRHVEVEIRLVDETYPSAPLATLSDIEPVSTDEALVAPASLTLFTDDGTSDDDTDE